MNPLSGLNTKCIFSREFVHRQQNIRKMFCTFRSTGKHTTYVYCIHMSFYVLCFVNVVVTVADTCFVICVFLLLPSSIFPFPSCEPMRFPGLEQDDCSPCHGMSVSTEDGTREPFACSKGRFQGLTVHIHTNTLTVHIPTNVNFTRLFLSIFERILKLLPL